MASYLVAMAYTRTRDNTMDKTGIPTTRMTCDQKKCRFTSNSGGHLEKTSLNARKVDGLLTSCVPFLVLRIEVEVQPTFMFSSLFGRAMSCQDVYRFSTGDSIPQKSVACFRFAARADMRASLANQSQCVSKHQAQTH